MALLAIGLGLLVDRLAGGRVPLGLTLPLGIGVEIVLADLLTRSAATAPAAPWVLAALALAGLFVGRYRFLDRVWGLEPAWIAATAVFACYAAPVVLSGEATFAGYIRLDDTATWLAMSDQLLSAGHDLTGLSPSSFEATVAFTIGKGYPVGAVLPPGVGAELSGINVAWLFQPYLALLAVGLALALESLLRPLIRGVGTRAAAAAIAAQPALLFGYALWGGVKELTAAMLAAALVALVPGAGSESEPRIGPVLQAWVPATLVALALVSALSLGGAVWLAPVALAVALERRRSGAGRADARWALGFPLALAAAAVALALAVALFGGRLVPKGFSGLIGGEVIGNLIEPLSVAQLFGIWPVGDFRLDPPAEPAVVALVALVAVMAIVGGVHAVGRRAPRLAGYGIGVIVVALAGFAVSSPWLGAKALAIGAPATLALAMVGIAVLSAERRTERVVLTLLIAGGVLWSNVAAYRDVSLAPRDRLAELERAAEVIGERGPTLITDYEPYAARHFLRESDAEGASELRRSRIPLRDGSLLDRGLSTDTDRLKTAPLLRFRTLVLRRSPLASRPPAPYELLRSGRFYEIWQRPARPAERVLVHLPLGSADSPLAAPRCRRVGALAERAHRRGGTIVVAPGDPVWIEPITGYSRPLSWELGKDSPAELSARAHGSARGEIEVPADGEWEVWIGGASVQNPVAVAIDGREVGVVDNALASPRQQSLLGTVALQAGSHEVEISSPTSPLAPGSARPDSVGPLILRRAPASPGELRELGAGLSRRELCEGRWDWLELLAPSDPAAELEMKEAAGEGAEVAEAESVGAGSDLEPEADDSEE